MPSETSGTRFSCIWTISHSTAARLISAKATGMPRNGSLVPQRPGPSNMRHPSTSDSQAWLILPSSRATS